MVGSNQQPALFQKVCNESKIESKWSNISRNEVNICHLFNYASALKNSLSYTKRLSNLYLFLFYQSNMVTCCEIFLFSFLLGCIRDQHVNRRYKILSFGYRNDGEDGLHSCDLGFIYCAKVSKTQQLKELVL